MARVTPTNSTHTPAVARAATRTDAPAICDLWQQLWHEHEAIGGYAATRDPEAYVSLTQRIENELVRRAGSAVGGRHIHLVASCDKRVVGQIEAWLEQLGVFVGAAPTVTCELRSLIVAPHARGAGTGKALVEKAAQVASHLLQGVPILLAAEVLHRNPSIAFYTRLGFAPRSWNAQMPTSIASPLPRSTPFQARQATHRDARALAELHHAFVTRKYAAHDSRFGAPQPVNSALIEHFADAVQHMKTAHDQTRALSTYLVVEHAHAVCAAAHLSVSQLEPPFVPVARAVLSGFSAASAAHAPELFAELMSLGRHIAKLHGAPMMEITDLDAPNQPIFQAALQLGAQPWSLTMLRER